MADRKITDLTALTTPASDDVLPIVDVSEAAAADKNKKITVSELLRGAPDGTSAAPSFAFESDGGNGMFLGGTDILAFSTGGSQAVTINASQHLGVGTSASPSGQINLTVNRASGPGSIQLAYDGADGGAIVPGSSGGLEFFTYTGAIGSETYSERMRIDSSGRLGLGTSSPGAQLDVIGSDGIRLRTFNSNTGLRLDYGNSNGEISAINLIANGITNGYIGMQMVDGSNGDLWLGGSGGRAMTIYRDGKVGIGTTSPGVRLHVNVDSSSEIDVARFQATNGTDIQFLDIGVDATANFVSYDATGSTGGAHVWRRGGGEAMRIDNASRLLVGTSTARTGGLLEVETATTGAARVHEFVNNANGTQGPVLVFHKTRGTSVGSNTVVASGDEIGVIAFSGADGDERIDGASIAAYVDATPGNNDMPGRLVFSTTADGANSPTERMRITNDGSFAFGRTTAREFFDINGKVIINHAGTSNQSLFALGTNFTHGVAMLLDNAGTSTGRTFVLSCATGASSAWRFLECCSGNNATTVGGDAEFRLDGDGNGYADNNWNSGGADYAEYFEWSDGNTNAEDRRGISVVLDGDKIREAVAGEDPIGVISGNPSVVGDSGWNKWSGKHLRDDFNSYLREEYSVIEWVDKEGTTKSYPSDDVPEDEIIPVDAITKTVDDKGNLLTRRVLNPDFDPDQEYIPREQRFEWDCVGLMGKLRIRKGQVTGSRWIKMRDISDSVEEWLVR